MQINTQTTLDADRAFNTVTELELAAVKRDRAQLEAMKEAYRVLAAELAQREQDLIERIDAGAFVLGEAWVVTRRRQNISWLTVCKRELGERGVLEARDAWPTTFYKELRLG